MSKNRLPAGVFIICFESAVVLLLALMTYLLNAPRHLFLYLTLISQAVGAASFVYFRLRDGSSLSKSNQAILDMLKNIEDGKELVYDVPALAQGTEGIAEELSNLKKRITQTASNILEIRHIVTAIASNNELSKMMNEILPRLLTATDSACGAFYTANSSTRKLELRVSKGFGRSLYEEFDVSIGEGLVGRAAERVEISVTTCPEDSPGFMIKGLTGDILPKALMFVPITSGRRLLGMLVLANLGMYGKADMEIAELFKYYAAIAVVNCIAFEHAERARKETVFQNNLIQELNRELKLKYHTTSSSMKNIIGGINEYAIYVLDTGGTILEWNHGAELMFDLPVSEAVGKNISIIYSEEEIKNGEVKARIDTVLKKGQFSDSGWKKKKDGSYFFYDVSTTALFDEQGNATGMTSITKDITETKRMQLHMDFLDELLRVSMSSAGANAVLSLNSEAIIEYCDAETAGMICDAKPVGLDLLDTLGLSASVRKDFIGGALKQLSCKNKDGKELSISFTVIENKWLNFMKYIAEISAL